ncbi:MAG: thiamine phosphate synthase [Planctomycetes bacterium]|nr:thiamine phosphate synthase [Planctomycetota bacterium]
MSEPRLPPTLLGLSPGDLGRADVARFVAAARRARDAGLMGLLLREPGLDDRTFVELARTLRAPFAAPAWFGVHDRAHVAAALGADGLHLGFRSLEPAFVRPWLGAGVALGLSTHASDDSAAWEAADYLFHGPVFDTPSKRGLVEPVGLAGLVRAKGRTTRPTWALGGIDPTRARDVLATGVQGLAVRGALFETDDPARAVERFLAELARRGSAAPTAGG